MRIGVDTGGTFTDVVVDDGSGTLRSFKVPSTPRDPSAAILDALDRLPASTEGAARAGRSVVHGSTVATNALLEGKTARAALLTTEGFEDVLEIGRQARPALYDLEVQRPRPLVPRDLRFGAHERTLPSGEVRTPLSGESVREAAQRASRAGAESIAVCFLHAYARPDHERQAGEILRETFQGSITLSTDLVREFREYERCSTAAVNAAVAPVVGTYLGRLEERLSGDRLRVMESHGGAISAARAASQAVRTVLSGPAAGVVAAQRAAAVAGATRLISFDMGGTSTDVSLIPGEILLSGETEVAGHPIRTPVIDVHTVGAGGGSIAWIDAGGALKVGPRSAGAEPGPACYGRGGPPTVTDANLLLGRIVPERFLDGAMPLDAGAAERAVGDLASGLGLGLLETASGILEIANVTMARALRHVSLFRGWDPGDFALCAFGGAGALHAADLADASGIPLVIVPPSPGVLSAWGLLAGDLLVTRSVTLLRRASGLRGADLDRAFEPIAREAVSLLEEEARSEAEASPHTLERAIDARYVGQSHELTVRAEGDWVEAFHDLHRRRYGFDRRGEEVEAVTLRVAARLPVPTPALPALDPGTAGLAPRTRRLWAEGSWREGVVVERSLLRPGETLRGPAVVTEPGATTWVPPRVVASMAPDGSLRLARRS